MRPLFLLLTVATLITSCVSPELAKKERYDKQRCTASGGRVVDNKIWPELMVRCIPEYEWKASDRQIAECRAQGNYYRVDYEGLFQGCYLPNPVATTQPVQAYDPSKNAPSCLYCRLHENDGDAYKPTTGYPSARTDYDWDWDYQPANGQWVCRGIQTGRYATADRCAMDIQDDNRWPG